MHYEDSNCKETKLVEIRGMLKKLLGLFYPKILDKIEFP